MDYNMWKWAELHPYLFAFLAFFYAWFIVWLITDLIKNAFAFFLRRSYLKQKPQEENQWTFPKST